jgi:vancomycin permeability regulator SanA
LALFLGAFSLLNLSGSLRRAAFDANLWWIDLRFMPPALARFILLGSAVCLLAFAVRPPQSAWRRWLTAACAGGLGLVCFLNALTFYWLLLHRAVGSSIPFPMSLLMSAALASVAASAASRKKPFEGSRDFPDWKSAAGFAPTLAVGMVCAALFPLAQMFCFGKTDYRRPADAAVVLGARVYADGRPSDALADRVRTACQLYRAGLVKKLIFSGGPGDGAISEPESMKRLGLSLGVKSEDMVLDGSGLNTQATVRNTEAIFARLHAARILAVSHFYHLPRIKLAYHRAGLEVYTVPARESYLLRQLPYNILREVAALWVYYFHPLLSERAG